MSAVFSDFELEQIGFKFTADDAYTSVECVGSMEEEMTAKVVTKKCRGVVRKKTVRGTGEGTLKLSAHIPYDVYIKAYGMELDTLIEGVKAYGRNSRHPGFALVCLVKDEDGNTKYVAYPNAIIENGVTNKIENGAEEVAEIELEISVMPDEYGNGKYQALADDAESVADTWMTAFTPTLVQKVKN